MPEPAHKRQLISTVYATPLMTPTGDLGLSIRLFVFELRETGDWDIFLGPPEQARAEIGGADQWVLKRREFSGLARVNKVTSASLGYPLSVFNKNSTLEPAHQSFPFESAPISAINTAATRGGDENHSRGGIPKPLPLF